MKETNLVLKYREDILEIFRSQPFILEKTRESFIVNKELDIFNLHSNLILDLDPENSHSLKNKIKNFFGLKDFCFYEKLVLSSFEDKEGCKFYMLNVFKDKFIYQNSIRTFDEYSSFINELINEGYEFHPLK